MAIQAIRGLCGIGVLRIRLSRNNKKVRNDNEKQDKKGKLEMQMNDSKLTPFNIDTISRLRSDYQLYTLRASNLQIAS